MTLISFRLALCLFVASATVCSAGQDKWHVRFDGVGPIKIGMSLSELNRSLNASYKLPVGPEERSCFYVEPSKHPGISVMILNNRVARIDVDASGVTTKAGIGNGAAEADALRVYGAKLKITPSQYDGPDSHFLTIRSNSRRYGIRFETYNGKVTRYYAGAIMGIALLEGCS